MGVDDEYHVERGVKVDEESRVEKKKKDETEMEEQYQMEIENSEKERLKRRRGGLRVVEKLEKEEEGEVDKREVVGINRSTRN